MTFMRYRGKLPKEERQTDRTKEREKEERQSSFLPFAVGKSPFDGMRRRRGAEENPAGIKKGGDSAELAKWVTERREELFPARAGMEGSRREASDCMDDIAGFLEDIRDAWQACADFEREGGYEEQLQKLQSSLEELKESNDPEAAEDKLSENVERYNFLHRQIQALAQGSRLEAAARVLERAAEELSGTVLLGNPEAAKVFARLERWIWEMIRKLREVNQKLSDGLFVRIEDSIAELGEGAEPPGEDGDGQEDDSGENREDNEE